MFPMKSHDMTKTLALVGSLFLPTSTLAQEIADTIYAGGPILTMSDALPLAEAVAVKDGQILAVGTSADLEQLRGPETKAFDLAGRTMLPGFFDAHGHVMMGGLQALSANLLAPPDGVVKDVPSLQEALKVWAARMRMRSAKPI